ncbi:MAG: U32 family peptidase [Clostridia bacterium]|nr:U32 family peptidase [Clostridia bacterium]
MNTEDYMSVELLAPAGNFSKAKTALYFGADAVYIGGKQFSLRAFADNFEDTDILRAVQLAHSQGKKLYAAVNIFAKNKDLAGMRSFLAYLADIGADAAIISDPGVFAISREAAPSLPVHISTQANILNKDTVKFWRDQGAARVILARELSLEEIAEIHAYVPDIELEAFVHGAMCISYSGRCMLSDYLTGRRSNGGECAQPCRWIYNIRKKDVHSDTGWLDISEDERGTYILNSKDLNMSAHLKEMEEAGITSFKIEGRMKSEYYIATVVNAYRRCLDSGFTAGTERELKTAAHRDYTTAYAFGPNNATENFEDAQTQGDCDYIGNVTGYEDGYAYVEMRGRFRQGDTLEILSPTESFGKSFVVTECRTSEEELVSDCKLVQEIYRVKCPVKVQEGDILRRRK